MYIARKCARFPGRHSGDAVDVEALTTKVPIDAEAQKIA